MRMLLTTLILSFLMLPAAAQTNKLPPVAESRVADAARELCVSDPARCKSPRNLVSFPAHALSWSGGNLALHYRGVDWTGEPGLMSFTMHRPKAYAAGAPVRLRIVYEVFGAGDRDSIGFSITPTSFNHGSGFETYGGESTGLIPANTGNIQEQSVTLTFPGSYSLGGNWWYFEINRVGESQDKIRLMSVSVEY